MKFKNDLEMWHKFQEFADKLSQISKFQYYDLVRLCKFYEYDSESCEEYCSCPERNKPTIPVSLLKDLDSDQECWDCKYFVTKEVLGESANSQRIPSQSREEHVPLAGANVESREPAQNPLDQVKQLLKDASEALYYVFESGISKTFYLERYGNLSNKIDECLKQLEKEETKE